MKKSLLTFLGLLMVISCLGQSWNNTGNTLQRRIIGSDTSYRFSLGQPGFMYLYTKPQVNSLIRTQSARTDSVRDNLLPVGFQGQQLKVKTDNSNKYLATEPLVYGQFVYTDDQLTRAFASGASTQLTIFNNFNRFAHGGDPDNPGVPMNTNNIPGVPSETNSWSYDTVANRFLSTFNSGPNIGIISRVGYDFYTHTATLGVKPEGVPDNDRIGLVIAFMEDSTDMVPNTAYGMDPADFNWPIDVTSPTVPNQHSLILFRNRDSPTLQYFIAYDYQKLTQRTIINGTNLSGLYHTTDNWPDNTVDMRVIRSGDTIRCYTSQFSDAPGGKGSLAFQLTLNLNSDPDLIKFKGKKPYGFATQSQRSAYFANDNFSETTNIVYDVRNGNGYIFSGSSYVLDPTKSIPLTFGHRFFWRNTTEHTFGYILPDNTYDVIVGETP